MTDDDTMHALNGSAWALGKVVRGRFHVRQVVWGLLLACYEVRNDEQIRACHIKVEKTFKRRKNFARV